MSQTPPPTPGGPGPDEPRTSERVTVLATVGGVLAIVGVVVAANVLGGLGRHDRSAAQHGPAPAAASTIPAEQLATMSPEKIAADALKDRGKIALQKVLPGTAKFRDKVQRLAGAQPYDFTMTSFNVLGSQHTAPGGDAQEYAPGRIRSEWAAALIASYGSTIVGLQEVQSDQLDAIDRATGGRFDFWPGRSLGAAGIPQSVMWDTSVWTETYEDSITVPFMGGTRPQPIVRLQNIATGREIYVMNIHNSPKDAQGREPERDKATAIEIAAIKQLRQQDGIPVFIMGDFNEHAEAFCKITGQTDLHAAQGGDHDGGCHPPAQMRVDWIFGSADTAFSGFRFDTTSQVRRITDHAVLTASVSVP
ncbi:MAG: endonuclease/exonuclease/phosphatase family protein [Nocardioides sp.]